MLTRDRVGGAALFLFALAAMWEDRVFPLGTVTRPGPGYMPMLLAGLLAAFALLVICLDRRSPALRTLEWPEKTHAIAILAGCAFAAFALERIGYRVTMMLLVAFLMGCVERKGVAATIITAVGLSVGTFYVFGTLLQVPLPLGPGGF